MDIEVVRVKNVLTRTTGYLTTVSSHSLQPYRGCAFGNSLCGVGCYVQHNYFVTRGRSWGSFLEVRENAAEAYLARVESERAWCRRLARDFTIFLSSSTEPFLPQERRYRVTRSVLEAMLEQPPDGLILQTHSHTVAEEAQLLKKLSEGCRLRVHLSIETDRERVPGLPPPASPVAARLLAAEQLHRLGLPVVVTVSPLLPIQCPQTFFSRLNQVARAVVLDHFVGGDGSKDGARTRRTPLPAALEELEPGSSSAAYQQRMLGHACHYFRGSVGLSIDGFAGRYLDPDQKQRLAHP